MKIFSIILIISCSISYALANQCTPSSSDCAAYLCLEQKHKCGYKGYPLKFGYQFCQNFLDMNPKSEKLKVWLKDVRYCLQDKIINNPDYNCKNFYQASIDAHVNCYNETGFCELSKKDQNYVKYKIMKGFFNGPMYVLSNASRFFKEACR